MPITNLSAFIPSTCIKIKNKKLALVYIIVYTKPTHLAPPRTPKSDACSKAHPFAPRLPFTESTQQGSRFKAPPFAPSLPLPNQPNMAQVAKLTYCSLASVTKSTKHGSCFKAHPSCFPSSLTQPTKPTKASEWPQACPSCSSSPPTTSTTSCECSKAHQSLSKPTKPTKFTKMWCIFQCSPILVLFSISSEVRSFCSCKSGA